MNPVVDPPAGESLLQTVVILLGGAVLGFFGNWFWRKSDSRTVTGAERDRRITELERQLSLVNQAVVPISTAFQAILIKELTHYHTPRMDELMVKLGPPDVLSEAEEAELIDALDERTRDMGDLISDAERDAARMLPMVMKRARAETEAAAATANAPVIKVVLVPPGAADAIPDVDPSTIRGVRS